MHVLKTVQNMDIYNYTYIHTYIDIYIYIYCHTDRKALEHIWKWAKWSPLLIGNLTAHSIEVGRSSPVPWLLSRQHAYSSPQAVALSHVGDRPHLSPPILPFASATKTSNCLGCYSFADPEGMLGWVRLAGWLIADVLSTKWSHNRLPVWHRMGTVRWTRSAF